MLPRSWILQYLQTTPHTHIKPIPLSIHVKVHFNTKHIFYETSTLRMAYFFDTTLPRTNMFTPEKWVLEDEISFWIRTKNLTHIFRGYVSFVSF